MKKYIQKNKGSVLLEHLVTILIFIFFINILTTSILVSKTVKNKINDNIKYIRIVKILDELAIKIKNSNNVIVKKNSIELNDIKVKYLNNYVYSLGGKMIRKFKLFECNDFQVIKKNRLIIIVVKINNKKIIRMVALR